GSGPGALCNGRPGSGSKSRRFICDQCGKKFTQSAHLKSHLSVHTGERPYACSICSRSFIVQYSLKLHMKKCHPNSVGLSAGGSPILWFILSMLLVIIFIFAPFIDYFGYFCSFFCLFYSFFVFLLHFSTFFAFFRIIIL
uniref:C2H2-type domain-containing protein n=1 Tax=Sphaeramia orbicularis TaxID=375764 RepID=A0A673BF98_9TELE